MGGGDTTVQAPTPTAAETALTQEQVALLRQQRDLMQTQLQTQDLLAPILYQQAGLRPIYGNVADQELASQLSLLDQQLSALPPPVGAPGGFLDFGVENQRTELQRQRNELAARVEASQRRITGFEELPDSPEEIRQRQMEELSFERAQSAFEMDKARFAQEQADLPNLQRQRELENKFRERSLADLEEQAAARGANAEVEGLIRQRTLAALKGELPVNPALLRELGEGEENLRSQLMKQLGTGFETSTPGIEALANFHQRKSELLEAARRGDLQMGEQMNFAREASRSQRLTEALPVLSSRLSPSGANFDAINQGFAGIQMGSGFRQQQVAQALGLSQMPGSTAGGFGNVAQGFGLPISAFQNQRGMQFNADIANASSANQRQAGYGALFGTALMAAAYMSDERVKEDIKRIGDFAEGIGMYSFRYIGEDVERVGVMAQEVEKVCPQAVIELPNGYKMVDYGVLANG